ncbi:hypothetical protein MNEG_15672 [Monoraphidium neglectum]|uniref:Uncharacterized protein n=1 Tax=Monoraphidium neglectum TaxID=145388 RepID=A0A0D2LQS3_9CHLO|nr:hypothetical protein MNEG_15672 [Monoraphidium neglectum]KIY92291.1 hypothetical protein MNEG_15672 [Monoraphidium neglectum]|eukprot:XP_013891311.1 hypothetical protein MNEG_15672 [Monoraphidium neglectum]
MLIPTGDVVAAEAQAAAGIEAARSKGEGEAAGGDAGDELTGRVARVEAERLAKERDEAAAAYQHAASKVGVDPASGPHPSPDALLHATTATGSPLIHSPLERGGGDQGRPFVIFSPKEPATSDAPTSGSDIDLSKEPPSQRESAMAGYGVGDPDAQAGGVALGKSAAHGLMSTLKHGALPATDEPTG